MKIESNGKDKVIFIDIDISRNVYEQYFVIKKLFEMIPPRARPAKITRSLSL